MSCCLSKKIFKVDILSTWCDAHILIKPRKGNGFRNSRFKTQSKEFRELSSKGGVKKNADLNSSSLIHPDSDEGWRDPYNSLLMVAKICSHCFCATTHTGKHHAAVKCDEI